VSTYGQTFDAQFEQLRAQRCVRIYREKASGTWRGPARAAPAWEGARPQRRGDGDADRPANALDLRPVCHRQEDCGCGRTVSITDGATDGHVHQHRGLDDCRAWRTGRRGARPDPHPHGGGPKPPKARAECMGRPSKLTDAHNVEARRPPRRGRNAR
jgi:hypothetical protein